MQTFIICLKVKRFYAYKERFRIISHLNANVNTSKVLKKIFDNSLVLYLEYEAG